jgi:hypothetical protein
VIAMPTSPRVLAAAGLLAAALAVRPAAAGEYLEPAELVGRAAAIAVVEVKLSRGKQKPSVQVLRTLRSPASGAAIAPDPSWLSLCLADRKLLQRWQHQHPKWPARKLWKQALGKGGYQAVAFLAPSPHDPGGPLQPTCGVEAMDLLHSDLHPDYASYLKQIETLATQVPARPVNARPTP